MSAQRLCRHMTCLIHAPISVYDKVTRRYHSIGSWRLALYNYLQQIFIGVD